jgi:glycosyltransferase involved in cell wall biosynthesis
MNDHAPKLIFVSKSRWQPVARREHALSRAAAASGRPVHVLERPLDVRDLASRAGRREWHAALRGVSHEVEPGIWTQPTAVVVPGHRSDLAERVASFGLARTLRTVAAAGDTVVASTPWQWPALAGLPRSVRRVFDCDDDWGALIPSRAEAFVKRYAQIAVSADAVIAVSPDAAPLFPGRQVSVVPNGVERALVDSPTLSEPVADHAVYLGTISPRFDAPLVREALRLLPGWHLDVYGQCQYPGRGDRPGPELEELLEFGEGRVVWHGVLERADVAAALDRAAVAIVPNRPALTSGQDAMKLYDYAARGTPIVTTSWSDRLVVDGPPGLLLADDPQSFAQAVTSAAADGQEVRSARRSWAAERTWDKRWLQWSASAFGEEAG